MALFTNLRNRIASSDRERGAVLVLTALVMMLLLFIAAFATDLGAWYRQGQEQQRAADVGALNGVQAYDRGVKTYFGTIPGADNWSDLTAAQKIAAEEAGMIEAMSTIVGLLETSGLTFSSSPVVISQANPPDDTSQVSEWQVTADDGTVVTVVRGFTVTDATTTPPRMARTISVNVAAPGEQYFSNVVRDAPSIERQAESVLSNCGAVCNTTFTLEPPFTGFDAAGTGDGYKPLLRGDTQIWAVNHHVKDDWAGDIVCMDRDTQSSCGNFAISSYNTPSRPVELLSNRVDKIYAPATRRSDNRAGLMCFDVARAQYCDDEFIDFWDSNNDWGSPALGVWEYNNQAWVLSHHGEIACVTTSSNADGGMDSCGEWDTDIVGNSRAWEETDGSNKMGWGTLIGSELYIIQRGKGNDPLFHCFDLSSQSTCWGGTVVNPGGTNYGANEATGFLRYSTGGVLEGICLSVPQNGDRHYCVNMSGTAALSALPNFSQAMVPLGNSWTGDAFTWNKQKTFFTGGNSDELTCYSWVDRDYCGQVDMEAIRPGDYEVRTYGAPRTGSEEIEPYALTQVTQQCLVGLGDQSFFFSFNPDTLDPCVEATVTAPITPCTCDDNSERWGEIRLPAELTTKVDKLIATVSDTEGGAPLPGLDQIDVLANGGYIDLSLVDTATTSSPLWLTLEVDAKLIGGEPAWTEDIPFDLQIVVQPTLSS